MKTYNAKRLMISFANIPIEGWADGDFIIISNEADAFGDVIGTDGEVTRFQTNDDRANVTIRTMQSSQANDALSAMLEIDQLTGFGMGAFFAQDTLGTSAYRGENAWIVKAPDATFGREPKEREWHIRVAKLYRYDGSNIGPP